MTKAFIREVDLTDQQKEDLSSSGFLVPQGTDLRKTKVFMLNENSIVVKEIPFTGYDRMLFPDEPLEDKKYIIIGQHS